MRKVSIVGLQKMGTLAALVCFLSLYACGGGTVDFEKQVSGKWQRTQEKGVVDINLLQDPATLAVNGQSFPVVEMDVDMGSFTAKVKVKLADDKTEMWSIRQIWNDNGSEFKLAFRHNGTTETLVPADHS